MSSHPSPDDTPAVAAIHHDGHCDVDSLLAAFAGQQRAAGRRVFGLLMASPGAAADCQARMVLTDIDRGDSYLVSQSLGQGSASCSADPQGFASASRVLRDALQQQPDLVIVNRFGSLEAENGGFVAELLALLEHDIPVLTVVSTRHLDAWQRFVGDSGALLPCEPQAWADWLNSVLQHRSRAAASATQA